MLFVITFYLIIQISPNHQKVPQNLCFDPPPHDMENMILSDQIDLIGKKTFPFSKRSHM